MAKTRYILEAQDKISPELQKISKALDKTQRDFDKAGKVLETAGKAFMGFFAAGKIVDAGKEALQAWAKQEQAILSLENALRMGQKTTIASSRTMQEFASRMQATFKVGDEVILPFIAQLAALGKSDQEIQKIINASLELSAVTGQDLKGAMDGLLNSMKGEAGELSKLFPELKGFTKEHLAAGGAVDLVIQKLGGYGAGKTSGLAGSLQSVQNSWGDLMEQVGRSMGVANPVTQWVDQAIQGFTDYLTKLNDVAAAEAKLRNSGNPLLSADEREIESLANQRESILAKQALVKKLQEKGFLSGADVGTLRSSGIIDGSIRDSWKASEAVNAFLYSSAIGVAQLTQKITELEKKIQETKKTAAGSTPGAFAGLGFYGQEAPKDGVQELRDGIWAAVATAPSFFQGMFLDQLVLNLPDVQQLPKKIGKNREAADKITNPEKAWETFQAGFQYFNTGLAALEGFYSSWMDLQTQQEQAAVESFRRQVQAMDNAYTAQLKTKRDLGEDTAAFETDQAEKIARAREELERREAEQKRRAWEANKVAMISNATMGTANAVVNALGMFPFSPANLIMAGLVGGLGAAQVGMIASQPTPEFAVGTPRVPRDMGAIVHQGEMIIPQTFAEGLRRGDLTLGRGGGPTVQINLSGAVYGSLEAMTKEINKELRRLSREGKL